MQTIGSFELETHLSEVLDDVENGQSVIVTRHGKPIARIIPEESPAREQTQRAVASLLSFPRTKLPEGTTIRSLIDEGEGSTGCLNRCRVSGWKPRENNHLSKTD